METVTETDTRKMSFGTDTDTLLGKNWEFCPDPRKCTTAPASGLILGLIPRPKKILDRDRHWHQRDWYRPFRYDTDIPVCLWILRRAHYLSRPIFAWEQSGTKFEGATRRRAWTYSSSATCVQKEIKNRVAAAKGKTSVSLISLEKSKHELDDS